MKVVRRKIDTEAEQRLLGAGISPLMAQLYAARGVVTPIELSISLSDLIPPEKLTHSAKMANLLADAIVANRSILVVGDYDADGATATAVAVKGLRSMGARVEFLVPNRFEYGYGLTPEIVQLAALSKPDIILTVDNGIASVEGVAAANRLGISVLITDHHLPAETTPQAACIVNPNQHGCDFPSKHLAGVGVMFYVLLALRAELRQRNVFAEKPEPNLTELLDLVALGTVADLVKLDANNRILVEQGLRRIRAGAGCAGIKALLEVAGRRPQNVNAQDLGFYVGPRLNAAGRLDDMRLGIQCLITDHADEALQMAQTLHALNLERRHIEADMSDAAHMHLREIDVSSHYSLSLFEPDWHQGVVGILASRIKERYHRPVIAFAEAGEGLLKGSGRSIAGLHMRDALDLVSKRQPNLIAKFGGHAMAAGLTIKQSDFSTFRTAFEQVVREWLTPADLHAVLETDGALDQALMTLETANILSNQVWGQGFVPPYFVDVFDVVNQRIVGDKHLKLQLQKGSTRFDAIYFNCAEHVPSRVRVIYMLDTNEYQNARSLQLQIKFVDTELAIASEQNVE